MAQGLTRLTPHLWVFTGDINVGVLVQGHTALLVDFGGGGVLRALEARGRTAPLEGLLHTPGVASPGTSGAGTALTAGSG